MGLHLARANGIYLCEVQYTYITFHECGSWSLLCVITFIGGGMVSRNSPSAHGVDSPGVRQHECVLWLSGQEGCGKW